MQKIPDRHLVRIALNLYSISCEKMPTFGGEIDQILEGDYKGDDVLLDFYLYFRKMFYTNENEDFSFFVKKICEINNKSERLRFFGKCCEIEIEQAKKHETPLIFYWSDYFLFKKTNDFTEVVKKAYKISKHLLEEKPQYTVLQVKTFLNKIILEGSFVFSNIYKIILYGSLAKGTNKNYSDVDLLIIFNNNDPLNPLVIKVLADSFKTVCNQFPDCNYIYKGQRNRFVDWILGYGVEVFCKDEK